MAEAAGVVGLVGAAAATVVVGEATAGEVEAAPLEGPYRPLMKYAG